MLPRWEKKENTKIGDAEVGAKTAAEHPAADKKRVKLTADGGRLHPL
jgi:hypothetical protein